MLLVTSYQEEQSMGSIPHIVEDLMLVQLLSDGSIIRLDESIFTISTKIHDDGTVVWKDCLFDESHNLQLRLYKPRSSCANLPILYYLHGGGFCCSSRTSTRVHNCCLRLASTLHVMVVSPDHRLTPEHRLPAAMHDTISSVKWLQNQAVLGDGADEWIRGGNADFSRVFVLGDSSGGNLAHHLAVELGPGLERVRVRGYVLMAPFFGGSVRTKSESEPTQKFVNADFLEGCWRVSLPRGSSADHPLANPFGPSSTELDSVKLDPILVIVGGCDVMKDRIEEYYDKLKAMSKEIEYVEFEGEEHDFLVNHPYSDGADKALQCIDQFILRNSV